MKRIFSISRLGMMVFCLMVTGISLSVFGNVLHVTTSGSGGSYTSIQAAIDAANAGDTIRVAEGTYLENLEMDQSVTLEGGWNEAFTERNWDTHPTTIDGQASGSVIYVPAGHEVVIDGFVITNGDGSNYLGWGGGIRVGESFNSEGFTTIRNNIIRDNVASTEASGQGEGGGIHVYNNQVLIENNKIYRNKAQTAPDQSGRGGGIFTGWMASATITGNEITTNTAALSPTGYEAGEGGGIYTYSSIGDNIIEDNIIQGNIGTVDGVGRGGGGHIAGDMKNNQVRNNIASKNGEGQGGGIFANYVSYMEENIITDNIASQGGDGTGGGVYAVQLQYCRGNQILNNTANRAGGLFLGSYSRSTVYHNFIMNNHATGNVAATYDGGGGISSNDNEAEIYENVIMGNTTNYAGGGILIYNVTDTTVKNNVIQGNLAAGGGGMNIYSSSGTVTRNTIKQNGAFFGGGMHIWGSAAPQFDRNIIVENTALGFFTLAGGGITVSLDSTAVVKFTNHIIARNATGTGGVVGGLLVNGGTCHLANCSIVDNNTGTYKEGVAFLSKHGTHSVFNTIVAGHTTGIYADPGVSTLLDYNDYYDNTTANLTGTSAGTHDLTVNPQFRNRPAGDYHLLDTSGLVNAGRIEPGVTADFEGDPRPRGPAFDIGADECYLFYAFVSAESGNDTTGDGASGDPFATVAKALAETEHAGTIFVAEGTYTGIYNLTRNVHLWGGFEDDTWTQDIKKYPTILDGNKLGCVIRIQGYFVYAEVEGFTITGGYANFETGPAGGISIFDGATATIRYNRITGNVGENEAGGILVYNETGWPCLIEGNRIYGNDSLGQDMLPPGVGKGTRLAEGAAPPGGGILIFGGPMNVINNFIYHNRCPKGGDGIAVLFGENVRILHNSFSRNGMEETGQGIYLRGNPSSYVIHNNIISGHHIGLKLDSGPEVDYDYNCFWDNDIHREGIAPAPDDVIGDPRFADAETGDLHIRHASAARDAGNPDPDYTSLFDLDEDARPYGAGVDIGADEMYNSPPMFDFLAPTEDSNAARNQFLIRWVDEDYDNDADISLYQDTDDKDFDGTMINGVLSEDSVTNQLAFDTSGLSEGFYYIHVTINDGVNDPVIKYAPFPVRVTRITKAQMIDHILGRAAIPLARLIFAELNNDAVINIADLITLLNLP